jgi:uncharacterized protein (DUF1810 family)
LPATIDGLFFSGLAGRAAAQSSSSAYFRALPSTLGYRVRQVVHSRLQPKQKLARLILGSPDDFKFRSCLSLFVYAACLIQGAF